MRDRSARAAAAVGRAIVAVVVVIGVTAIALSVAATPAAADGEITIEVMANGNPADSAPGPSVESGASVNLRYVVTVGSTEPLYDFVVSNETGDAKPSCDTDDDGQPDGTNNHPGPLEAGDSFICVTSVVAGDPGVTYASVGRVTAYNVDITETFTHEDAAHYTTVQPTTTTQAPTTQAPATAAPTTAAPTSGPTTTVTTSTTSSTTASTTSTASTTPSTSPSTSPSPSPSTTAASTKTAAPTDADAAAPDELAATDDDRDGFPLWWMVLAFAAGGGIAAGVVSHLVDKTAAVPDQ